LPVEKKGRKDTLLKKKNSKASPQRMDILYLERDRGGNPEEKTMCSSFLGRSSGGRTPLKRSFFFTSGREGIGRGLSYAQRGISKKESTRKVHAVSRREGVPSGRKGDDQKGV